MTPDQYVAVGTIVLSLLALVYFSIDNLKSKDN